MAAADDDWTDPPGGTLKAQPEFHPIQRTRPKRRFGLRVFVGVIVVAAGAGAGAWYFLDGWFVGKGDSEVPLIRAEGGPVKVRPDSPGGMAVPDQDKLVYDRMEGNGERDVMEKLLPPPEMPLPKPGGSAATGSASSPSSAPASPPAAAPTPAAPQPAAVATAPTAPPPPAAPAGPAGPPAAKPTVEEVLGAMRPPPPPPSPAETVKPAPPPEAKAKPEAPASATQGGGGYRVQLAAVRSREEVESEWDRMRRRYPDLLGSLELSVMRADLGPGKGIYFRMRAGPLADEKAARALCEKLAERKIGCLVVRPEE